MKGPEQAASGRERDSATIAAQQESYTDLRADQPFAGTPPAANWRWYNGLDAARPERQPQRPSLIAPGGRELTAMSLAALGAAVAGLLRGRAPTLTRCVATFEGYDSFPAFTVKDEAGEFVGCVAVQKTPADEVLAAIAAAQAQQVAA